MRKNIFHQRPLLSLPQILVLLTIFAALVIALDLNRRAQAGQVVSAGEAPLEIQVEIETTRQVELRATLSYVQSDDYIESYARNEGSYVKASESRIVPLFIATTPEPPPPPLPTPDPAHDAQPWQAWWQLLVDSPLPTR